LRLFTLLGALLVAGGAYLLIDGGLRLARALEGASFSARFWTWGFWFAADGSWTDLAPNARWLLRIVCGLVAVPLGSRIVRVATR
jgi:hypothetical protein